MNFRPVLFLTLAACAAPAAAQTVYKCTDASGKVQFVDQPCSSGSAQQSLEMTHKEISFEGRKWVRVGEPDENRGGGNYRVDFKCINSRGRTLRDTLWMFCNQDMSQCQDARVLRPGEKPEYASMNQIAVKLCAQRIKNDPWLDKE